MGVDAIATFGSIIAMAEAERGERAEESGRIEYVSYKDETQLPDIMALIDQELSEPYSIFTYRYFITLWPDLCFMVCSQPNPSFVNLAFRFCIDDVLCSQLSKEELFCKPLFYLALYRLG